MVTAGGGEFLAEAHRPLATDRTDGDIDTGEALQLLLPSANLGFRLGRRHASDSRLRAESWKTRCKASRGGGGGSSSHSTLPAGRGERGWRGQIGRIRWISQPAPGVRFRLSGQETGAESLRTRSNRSGRAPFLLIAAVSIRPGRRRFQRGRKASAVRWNSFRRGQNDPERVWNHFGRAGIHSSGLGVILARSKWILAHLTYILARPK